MQRLIKAFLLSNVFRRLFVRKVYSIPGGRNFQRDIPRHYHDEKKGHGGYHNGDTQRLEEAQCERYYYSAHFT
jgi:hypothetical protein